MRRRAFTLVELLVGMTILAMVMLGVYAVFSSTMTGFYKTRTDIVLADENALGMRRVAETLRGAYSIEVLNEGGTVKYFLPLMTDDVDPVTGEREIVDPPESDGIERWFVVENGVLLSKGGVGEGNFERELVENIVSIDPLEGSSQYNKVYPQFQLTTIGSRRALTINLITADTVLDSERFRRMKTTVIIRNSL